MSSGFSENKGRYFINSVPIYRFLYCTLSSSVPRYLEGFVGVAQYRGLTKTSIWSILFCICLLKQATNFLNGIHFLEHEFRRPAPMHTKTFGKANTNIADFLWHFDF